MNTTKIIALTAMTALSLGIGAAMAEESANEPSSHRVAQPTTLSAAPRYGSSDKANANLSDGTYASALDDAGASNWGDPPEDYTSGRGCPPCH